MARSRQDATADQPKERASTARAASAIAIAKARPAAARRRSISITGRRRTAGRSRSCWRSAGCRTASSRSTFRSGDQFKPEFLAISPNNRMPAIVDPRRSGRPVDLGLRVRRDPAISRPQDRQVLSEATSAPASRSTSGCSGRWPISVPRRGRRTTSAATRPRSCHTRSIASPTRCNRLYGVMNRRLADRDFLAGKYSIADMACIGWVSRAERFGHDLNDFPNVMRWRAALLARPAVKRGLSVQVEAAFHVDMKDPKVRAVLFGQQRTDGR